jgi:hypothetical protein
MRVAEKLDWKGLKAYITNLHSLKLTLQVTVRTKVLYQDGQLNIPCALAGKI